MKVFISWSGDTSRTLAERLRDWLPNVIQALKPWVSSQDIEKGARWNNDLIEQLQDSRVGIICVTCENLDSAWVNFEAGALLKTVDSNFVCPYLLDLKPTSLQGPLIQFQTTEANKRDTRRMLDTINRAQGENSITDNLLDRTFELWWPELERTITKLREQPEVIEHSRSDREILEEILSLIRQQARKITSSEEVDKLLRELGPDLASVKPSTDIVERLRVLRQKPESMRRPS